MYVIEMIAQASFVVQLVMLLLLVMSLYVWVLLFAKLWMVRNFYRKGQSFRKRFENSDNLGNLYSLLHNRKNLSPLELIFLRGFKEYVSQSKMGEPDPSVALDQITRRMEQVFNKQMDLVDERISNLATIASSAPYIGLFGTVIGIINSFQALGKIQHATLALVAPGISEALIATAMGLFVAIPAVIGYNRLQSGSERLANYCGHFVEDFTQIVERQLRTAKQQ